MARVFVSAAIDVRDVAPVDVIQPTTPNYIAPRLVPLGDGTALVRGGGGMSGNDCHYYYYYTSGPYGC